MSIGRLSPIPSFSIINLTGATKGSVMATDSIYNLLSSTSANMGKNARIIIEIEITSSAILTVFAKI